MTFIGEHDGKAYRTKSTSIFFDGAQANLKGPTKTSHMKKLNSSFFHENPSASH
jgi:hypothetical protein